MHNSSVLKHLFAFIYDLFPILGIIILTSGLILVFRNGVAVEPYTWWYMLVTYCEITLYYVYFWKVGGQTIGMKAWKLKIKPNNENKSHLSWTQALVRFFVGIISTVLLGLGLFWKLISKKNLSWMDLVSDSTTQVLTD